MGILFECPDCKRKHNLKKNTCQCGKSLKKLPHKIYWIEYYVDGKRRRERIGPSKKAAKTGSGKFRLQRLKEDLSAKIKTLR